MQIITGTTGSPHITADQDAMWHKGIWADDCIIKDGNNMSHTIQSNNEIRIRDGICSIQGRFACIDRGSYETVRIDNGLQGQRRIDLIVIVYEKHRDTNYESMSIAVKKGTSTTGSPTAPSYTRGTIGVDRRVETPLYEVHLNGLSITSVTSRLRVQEPCSSLASKISTLESFENGTRDYITSVADWNASGITGGKIIKYHSGRCEIYGQQTLSTNFSVQRVTNIYSTEALTLNFPVTFKSKPTVTATIDDIKNLGFVGYTAPTTTKSTYTLVNVGTNGTYTCKVNWYIVGEV